VQARFLCGPAGSGKTFRCLEEIRASLKAAAEGPPLVFIAPKQSTFQLERQLLGDGTLNGYTRLQILSFERLAQCVFDKFNVAPPEFLTDEGRVMVVRSLLLRHESQLKLFRGSARRPGFAQEVSRLLAEFQQHQVSPARLRTLGEDRNLRPELCDKLCDLALLFECYSSWLADHKLRDGNCLLDEAAKILYDNAKNPALNFGGFWLDGFAEMTPQEMDLVAAIVPFCQRATLAFCIESGVVKEDTTWLSIWSAVGNTLQRCRQRIERLGGEIKVEMFTRAPEKGRFGRSNALRHLEAHWEAGAPAAKFERDGDSALRMVACSNPDSEAVLAAREIMKFVHAGNRYRDCAVLVRDLELYHKTLSRTFRRYGVPFFLDRRESVAHHPLAELTRNALRVVAYDWQHEDWFAALKTGFCAARETEIDRLENESLARGWYGKKWREPIQIPGDPALEQLLEGLRQKIVPPFEKLAGQLAELKFQPNGKELAEFIRRLWKDLRVKETLDGWNVDETKEGCGSLRPAVHATVWDEMNGWLENVELAFLNEAMPLREWLPVMEAGLANLTVGVIPPALDEVLIGAVDRARNPELKFSLILGVNDQIFPAAPPSPAVLTDADRAELNFSLGADLRERLARERYYGYIAFSRASEQMIVSYSRNDSGGRPLKASPFVTRLRGLFPEIQIVNFDGRIEISAVEGLNELVPLIPEMEKAELPNSATFSEEILSDLIKSLGELREPDPSERVSPVIAAKLYGRVFRTSVSRLEEFAQCPFKFFVRSGLSAAERKVFELDARERGTFQHEVLKVFHEQLVAENKRWRDLTPAQARERVGQIAGSLAGDFRDGLLRDSAQTRFAARAMTESLQNFIEVVVSWMCEQYEFDPVAVELDFGEEDSSLPAWSIALDGGRELSLRGRIDRVDLCREPDGQNGMVVVMDYKSSRKKLDPLLVEHGVQLQLAAYLSALSQFPMMRRAFEVEQVIPAGVFYVNLRGQFENGKTRGEVLGGANSRRAAYRHTGKFDAGVVHRLDSAGAGDQFHYTRRKDGTMRQGGAEALAQAEFRAWLGQVESQLRRIGNEIFSGAAAVDPYQKGGETPCGNCDYAAACRIDAWTHRFRVLSAVIEPRA
jgi:ATP-dependent helicase/nuclease subunit B